MITLALDASASVGTAAVFRGTDVVASGEVAMKARDSETLLPLAVDVLGRAGVSIGDVERIACGAGPGSFTSLRIAASIAKGFVVARDIPLYAVSSLALIVAANATDAEGRFFAVLDALRGESYGLLVKVSGRSVTTEGRHRVVAAEAVPGVAKTLGARVVGPGLEGSWHPHAKGSARLFPEMEAVGPVNVARWEPDYGRKAEAQARWEATHGRPLEV